mmetsp:Transcript_137478/g.310311  ORF Transcript_137478/g.310311 Transcript_137478/m.310311 type:complete len:97 (-) Transcript_137478:157-447(-)
MTYFMSDYECKNSFCIPVPPTGFTSHKMIDKTRINKDLSIWVHYCVDSIIFDQIKVPFRGDSKFFRCYFSYLFPYFLNDLFVRVVFQLFDAKFIVC